MDHRPEAARPSGPQRASANKTAQSAATARNAANQTQQSAREAMWSANWATASANQAALFASQAYSSAQAAYASAEAAGQDAQAAAESAWGAIKAATQKVQDLRTAEAVAQATSCQTYQEETPELYDECINSITASSWSSRALAERTLAIALTENGATIRNWLAGTQRTGRCVSTQITSPADRLPEGPPMLSR